MSGEMVSKLRVVKCPNCRLLLPEYPEYNLYKCGGCGTTLRGEKSNYCVPLYFSSLILLGNTAMGKKKNQL